MVPDFVLDALGQTLHTRHLTEGRRFDLSLGRRLALLTCALHVTPRRSRRCCLEWPSPSSIGSIEDPRLSGRQKLEQTAIAVSENLSSRRQRRLTIKRQELL